MHNTDKRTAKKQKGNDDDTDRKTMKKYKYPDNAGEGGNGEDEKGKDMCV